MLKEYFYKFVSIAIKLIFTFVAIWTIQNLLQSDGFIVNFGYLLIVAILNIIIVNMWVIRIDNK